MKIAQLEKKLGENPFEIVGEKPVFSDKRSIFAAENVE
jgi:hypothetical protein